MARFVRLGLFLALLSAGTAGLADSKQDTPSIRRARCGGVSQAALDEAFKAALDHVSRKGPKDRQQFLAAIQRCPKVDLKYYRKVLGQ